MWFSNTHMHTWYWQAQDGGAYLTCSLLEQWGHGFFTQRFWPHTPETLVSALSPSATVHRVRQVHGDRVLKPSEIEEIQAQSGDDGVVEVDETGRAQADGVMSDAPEQSVWVCTADCNPVLIADGATGQVAAVHAGWRGTALKIVPMAIARLQEQGSQLADLRVVMGPAIAGQVYQVSTQVAAEVGATVVDPCEFSSAEAMLDSLQAMESPPILPDPEPGRKRLDVRRINALQLQRLGLTADQIAIAPHCTYQEPETFFSYRRTRQKRVQWSGIVSQG